MTRPGRSYLDHNATAPLRPEAREAVMAALALAGNPSSVHAEGRAARAVVEQAREEVAALVGASPDRVVFTSGGTESCNLALRPGARRAGADAPARFLAGATEHVCVLEGHGFPDATRLPVDDAGCLRLDALAEALGRGPALVSIQAANNETGALQPVAEAARLARACGGLLHTDAVQAAGRVPLDVGALGVDLLSLSAHKLGGPQGIGALVLGPGVELGSGLVRGGGQERGRRGGTEPVALIAGFGAACRAAGRELAGEADRLAALRDGAEAALRRIAPDTVVFGAGAPRLPNTLAFAVPGLRAETALIALDLAGLSLSSGSACSSGKVRRSHVLAAMGVPAELSDGALRLSFGWNSTLSDVERFATAFETLIGNLYERRAHAA